MRNNKMKTILKNLCCLSILLIMLLSSCGYTEKDAEKVIENFLSAYKYGDDELTTKYYPSIIRITRVKTINSYEIEKIIQEDKESFIAYLNIKYDYGTSKIKLYLKKQEDNLNIASSKGLLYKHSKEYINCEKLGCISDSNTDEENQIVINTICKNLEEEAIDFVYRNFSINKDIEIVKTKSKLSIYDTDKYVEMQIKNNSLLTLSTDDLTVSVSFYDSKGGFLQKDFLNFNKSFISPFETVTASTNYKKSIYSSSLYVPWDAKKTETSISLNTSNVIDIFLRNSDYGCK